MSAQPRQPRRPLPAAPSLWCRARRTVRPTTSARHRGIHRRPQPQPVQRQTSSPANPRLTPGTSSGPLLLDDVHAWYRPPGLSTRQASATAAQVPGRGTGTTAEPPRRTRSPGMAARACRRTRADEHDTARAGGAMGRGRTTGHQPTAPQPAGLPRSHVEHPTRKFRACCSSVRPTTSLRRRRSSAQAAFSSRPTTTLSGVTGLRLRIDRPARERPRTGLRSRRSERHRTPGGCAARAALTHTLVDQSVRRDADGQIVHDRHL